MKKVLAVSVFAILGVAALSSCKKDYDCMYNGDVIGTCTDCSKAQKDTFKAQCVVVGGTVEKK